jgi:hypothetical protein
MLNSNAAALSAHPITNADLQAMQILERFGQTSSTTFARKTRKTVEAAGVQLSTCVYKGFATLRARRVGQGIAVEIYSLSDLGRELMGVKS